MAKNSFVAEVTFKLIRSSSNSAYNCHNSGRICLIARLRLGLTKSFKRVQIQTYSLFL